MDTDPARNLIAAQRPMTDTDPATARAPAADRRSLPVRMLTDARGPMTDTDPATVRGLATDLRGLPAMTDTSPATVRALATDLRGPLVAPKPATDAAPAPSRAFSV